jgi:hypothetical protein
MKKKDKEEQLQSYVQKILDNIEVDRAKADHLLEDIMGEIKVRKNEYSYLGPVAAKYLESLTRCNEQLVRLVSLLKPRVSKDENEELTSDDREVLFDVFQKDQNKISKEKTKKEKI